MPTETQRPDGATYILTALTGAYTLIDDDPDSSGLDFVVADGNGVNTAALVGFPTPTGNPTTGANKQEFRIQVREFDAGQTGTPKARIELWENGVLIRAGSDVNVTSQDQVIAFTWDASELGTADGSLVECNFVGTKAGGSPTTKSSTDLGAVEWNVEYSAGAAAFDITGAVTVTSVVGAALVSI